MIVAFTVWGVPLPKGNHRAFTPRGMHFPVITESNRNVISWQQLVKHGASAALNTVDECERRLLTEGVRVSVVFALPRPKTLPKRISAHLKAPDLDKLARAVCDAMTSVIYRDDNQVVELIAAKRYAALGEPANATIRVEPTPGVDRLARVPPVAMALWMPQ